MITSTLLLLGVPLLGWWIYSYLLSLRQYFLSVPSPKRHWLLGSLPALTKVIKPDRHPDYGLEKIYEDLGRPECFFLDILPLHSILVVTSPALAEQLTRASTRHPYSTPKSFTMADIVPMIGKESIIIAEGEEWKNIRKQFSAGFQPKHLQTLIPLILEESKVFVTKCLEKCNDEAFELRTLTSNFTLDVIGKVVLNEAFNTQTTPAGEGLRSPTGALTAYEKVQVNVTDRGQVNLDFINPMRVWRLRHYERILDKELQSMIIRASESLDSASRSVVSLALKDRPLTPATLKTAADQLRSFIFAGFDTTSSLIQWAFYYLNVPSNLAILEAVIEEHEVVLGPYDQEDRVEAALRDDPSMPITMAVIKECLRLQPPGATVRWLPPDQGPFDLIMSDGTALQVASASPIYICQKIINNTPSVWGDDAKVFRPSRWLDKDYIASLPIGAFRPFERGPRSCIGQELALLEAKILLAMTLSRFAFKKVTDVTSDLGDAWNMIHITSGPHDGMKMSVTER